MLEALQVGPFIFWTHLVFILLGIWLSAEFFFRLAQSAGLSLHTFKEMGIFYIVAFLLGGRAFTVLENFRLYTKDWSRVLVLWDGNFSFLGAATGIAIVLYLSARQSRTTFLQWLDVLLPAATFGLVFDWLGKFAAGQSYGAPTDMPWGVTYDSFAVSYTIPIHPVQLYYAVFYFLLTFLLLIVRRHSKRAGAETLFGIVVAAVATMVLELFRGDPSTPVFASLLDIFVLFLLFGSLTVVALFERRLSGQVVMIYEIVSTMLVGGYFLLHQSLHLATYQLRFSQFLAVLALLTVVVYVVVHRQRHPHL
jgi:phosphatidylglycerol:prolipoprotein diacylglycerol transferase